MSKNATKLYIHVGYPKCASSFLQMEVFFKDKRIKFHGIIRDPDNSISFKKVKFNSLIDTFARYARGKTNFAPKSKDLFELMNHDINVISDEDFISNGIISVEDKALRIKNIFPSAEIIVVVRSPISFLKSLYYFYFRGGLINVGFNDWVNKEFLNYENSMNLQYFHYEKYIGIFVKNFGKDNVHVLNLEDLKYNSDAFLSSYIKL